MPRKDPLPPAVGWEYVSVGESALHGRGLFAATDLPKGTHIMEYRGEKVPRKEGTKRTDEQWEQGRVYTFELNKRFDIDGSPEWNLARLANFSCEPNAESQNERGRRIWIVAKRDIRKGEEITYDYNFTFSEPPPECHCGAERCRGYIVGAAHVDELKAWLKKQGLPLPPGLQPRRTKQARKRTKRPSTTPSRAGQRAQPKAARPAAAARAKRTRAKPKP